MKKFYSFICAAIVACSANATDLMKFLKFDTQVNTSRTLITNAAPAKKQAAKIAATAGAYFNISVSEVTATTVTVSFTPVETGTTYFATVLEKADFDSFATDADCAAALKTEIDETIEFYNSNYGTEYTYEDFSYTQAVGGTVSSLSPATEYVALAYGVNPETMDATTPVEAVEFKTVEAEASDNQISMTFADGKVNITTTNDDPYFFVFETKADYDKYQSDYSQESVAAELQEWIDLIAYYGLEDTFTFTGNQSIDVNTMYTSYFSKTGMVEGTSYVALAAGYNGVMSTDAQYLEFEYTAGDNGGGGEVDPSGDLTFTIEVSDITDTTARMDVTPSNDTDYYYFDLCTIDELMAYDGVEDLAADFKEAIDYYIEYYTQQGYSVSYYNWASHGADGYDFDELEPNTQYVAFAFGIDPENFTATTDLTIKTFTTAEEGTGGETPEIEGEFAATIEIADITATTATATVTPEDLSAYFYTDKLAEAKLSEYDGVADLAANIKESWDYYIDLYAQYGQTLTYADFVMQGVDNWTYEGLDPGEKYVIFAYSIDSKTGLPTSELLVKHFETLAGVDSENEISLNYADGVVTLSTTNDDPYFLIMETKAEYDQYEDDLSDDSLLEEIKSWIELTDAYGYTQYFTFSGSQELNVNEFWTTYFSEEDMEEGQYLMLAAPYAGYVNGAVKYVLFDYTVDGITNVYVADKLENIKMIKNGNVVIRNNNKLYNTKGIQVK